MPCEYHLAWHRIVSPHPSQSVLARVGLVFFPRFDHTHHGSLGRSSRGGLGACSGVFFMRVGIPYIPRVDFHRMVWMVSIVEIYHVEL